MAIELDEFSDRLDKFAKGIRKAYDDGILKAAKNFEGDVKLRIFDEGLNAKESRIGTYGNAQYKRKRQKAGKQTGTVDLKFTGNLQRSVKTQSTKKFAEVVVSSKTYKNGANTADVSRYHDERYGKVFKPAKSEVDTIMEVVNDELKDYLNGIFK